MTLEEQLHQQLRWYIEERNNRVVEKLRERRELVDAIAAYIDGAEFYPKGWQIREKFGAKLLGKGTE